MKLIPTIIVIACLFPLSVRSQGLDSLDASSQWHTYTIDSTRVITGGVRGMRGDSTYYADPRKSKDTGPVYQLQIDVSSSIAYSDTIIVKRLMKGAYNVLTDTYDSVWVPVPLMNLFTATVDSIGIITQGPYQATGGGMYRYGSFLVYDAFSETNSWRIERQSGPAHPIAAKRDNSKTHKLTFEFYRRKSL